MQIQSSKFCLVFTSKVQKKLDTLSSSDRKQYDKAFKCFAEQGAAYRSLRTHRYRCKYGVGVLLHLWQNGFTGVTSISKVLRLYT